MTDTTALRIQTPNFGELEVPADKIIQFRGGIPGFPFVRSFAVLEFDDLRPFRYLQSLEEPPIALLIVNPGLLRPEYSVQLAEGDLKDLEAADQQALSTYVVATIPAAPGDATMNLMAPILVNESKRLGKQVIMIDSGYSVQEPMLVGNQ